MPPHPLTNFEIQQYYQNNAQQSSKNEPRFNGVYSRDYLDKIKDGVYLINLDEYSDIGTLWIALYASNNNVTCFASLELNTFQKKLKHLSINQQL